MVDKLLEAAPYAKRATPKTVALTISAGAYPQRTSILHVHAVTTPLLRIADVPVASIGSFRNVRYLCEIQRPCIDMAANLYIQRIETQ